MLLQNDFICTDCGGISIEKIQLILSSIAESKQRKRRTCRKTNNNSKKRMCSKRKWKSFDIFFLHAI